MKAFTSICCLAMIASTGVFQAGSKPDDPRAEATLELKDIAPPPGSIVNQTMVIAATLEYSINEFKSRGFFATVMFETRSPNTTMGAPGSPFPEERLIRKASGTVTVRQPLGPIWRDSNLARPFKVWFYLHQRQPGGQSVVIAEIGPIEYKVQ